MLSLSGVTTSARRRDMAIVALFMALCAWILWRRGYRWGDDDWFLGMVRTKHLSEFLVHRYTEWSSRISIEAAIALTIEHLWLWRFLNWLMVLCMVWLVAKLLPSGGQRSVLPLFCAGFFLFDPQVLYWSIWWVTGSFNYFWPAVLAMLAMLPFLWPEAGRRVFWFSIPAVLFAGFHEQVVLLLLGLQLVLAGWLWRQKRLTELHLLQMALCGVLLLVVLWSPGSRLRFQAALVVMPGFERLALWERLVQGLDNFLGHIFFVGNGVTWLWVVMLTWLVWQLPLARVVRVLMGIVLMLYTLVLVAPWILLLWPDTWMGITASWLLHTPAYMHSAWDSLTYSLLDPANKVGVAYWARMGLFTMAVWILTYATYACLRQTSSGRACLAVVMVVASVLTSAVVGLSPTVYLSGQRVFLFSDLLLLLVCCMLYQAAPAEKAWPRWLWGVVALLAGHGVWQALTKA